MLQKCLVLMDFDVKYREVYDQGIKPAVKAAGITCTRADELPMTQNVLGQTLAEIQNAALIVGDLTGGNPNVAFEIGYARHIGVQTILISQSLESAPYNFRNQRIVDYAQTDEGLVQLKQNLKEMIDRTFSSPAALLRKMIIPPGEHAVDDKYVVAASPLTFAEKKLRQSTRQLRKMQTYAEYVGITGLIQAFGLIFELKVTPALINPRDFSEESVHEQCNLYLLGSSKSNRWTGEILRELSAKWQPTWRFGVDSKSPDPRDPWLQVEKDGNVYEPADVVGQDRKHTDFGLILRAPHPRYEHKLVLVLAGRTGLGTAAACAAATSPELVKLLVGKGIDLGNFALPFWAIATAKRESGESFDPGSVAVAETGYLSPRGDRRGKHPLPRPCAG